MVRHRKRLSKYERREEQKKIKQYHQKGEGLYVFRNRSNEATLSLLKPSADGKKMVGPNEEFEGDSYFFQMVPQEAILVKTIRGKGEKMDEQLILDQPDQVTSEGKVEHVVSDERLNEMPEEGMEKSKSEVLLTEDPLDGVTIITD